MRRETPGGPTEAIRNLMRASTAVATTAMIALALLFVIDPRSSVFDRILGALILVAVLLFGLRRSPLPSNHTAPAWRPRDIMDLLVPFGFPLVLGGIAAERGSSLQWLGWSLLLAALAIQLAIWRVERRASKAAPPLR